MKLTVTILIALFAMASPARAGEKPQADDTVKFQFSVRPGGTLYLDLDFGNIEIESSGSNAVYVELERIVRGADAEEEKEILEMHEYDVSQDGNNIVIQSRFDEDGGDSWFRKNIRNKRKFRLNVTVRVPDTYNVDFESSAGNFTIADLKGKVFGRTGAGNLTIGNIDGPVEVQSGAGNVDIESVVGYVNVRTGAGNITIDEVAGQTIAHTGAGNVEATLTSQPDEDSELNSGAGNVTVYLARDIAVDVNGRSSLGSASCEFDLVVEGKWMSKSFNGSINGGGPALTLHAGVGNVALRRY